MTASNPHYAAVRMLVRRASGARARVFFYHGRTDWRCMVIVELGQRLSPNIYIELFAADPDGLSRELDTLGLDVSMHPGHVVEELCLGEGASPHPQPQWLTSVAKAPVASDG